MLVLAIRYWCPYLIGRKFIIYSNQKSLRHLLEQPIITLAQQYWLAKLLGYNFDIIYKPGASSRVADALSRCIEVVECDTLSMPQCIDLS